ncbi:substrate-binding domain-containing protein [Actinomycetospora chibensis]|uniref:Substrate-binding domain-containing protein n=1 Tax=Actinomycetospora chibensis TaxID=663606 RepID=A0ABV9RNN5_9PSEU|nr:substrate-binding domain-containing protein [Actinomycetospora chibensis]MDD7923212.1 substrate-binding domain-containing protein [Actinomycetospora chibensis]
MEEPFRVGLAIPLQGPGGIFGPSCEAVAELAAAEVNAAGGVLGRELELTVIDAGTSLPEIRRTVHHLLERRELDAVTGWHISSVREALAPVLRDRAAYVYTSLYEGGPIPRGVFTSGEVPELQVAPALEWMRDNARVRRWALVGADYVWPRRTAARVREYARAAGIEVVHEAFVSYGCRDFSSTLVDIARSEADGVLMLLVGQDAVMFNREFAEVGLDSIMPRFAPLMEENMLLATGAEATGNLYVAAAYFSSLATTSAMDFMSAYVHRYGPDAPALNNAAESCYEGLLALTSLTRAAGSVRVDDVAAVAAGTRVTYEGPRGTVALSGGGRGESHQAIHLARADGYDFDVLTTL